MNRATNINNIYPEPKEVKCGNKEKDCAHYFIKYNSLQRLCKWCEIEKVKAKGFVKKKPINKVSAKRKVENESYKLLRKAFLLKFPICQGGFEGCGKEATTVHHSKGRLGKLLCDVKYFKGLCISCHDFVERNPVKAKELGLSLDRLSK